MSTPEQKAAQEARLRASQWKCRLLKNNSGVAYDSNGRPVFFGLGNEGNKDDDGKHPHQRIRTSDGIGYTMVTITPEMVGKQVPIFTAIDYKKSDFIKKVSYPKGTREHGQQHFFNQVIDANGIAGFAASARDIDDIMQDFNNRIMK